MIDEVKLGIYRHYKGNLYQVLGIAHDANADGVYEGAWTIADGNGDALEERKVVVYIGLQLDGAHLGPRMAVRTLEDFTEPSLCLESGCRAYGRIREAELCNAGGHLIGPRFYYLGTELTASML